MTDRSDDSVIESGLSARGLGFSRAGRPVFSGIDFKLGPGELLQVTGANGSGKTSLLRVLSGLLPPEEGELRWHDRPVRSGESGYLQSMAYVGHTDGIDPDLSATENLQFAMRVAGDTPSVERIEAALASLGMAKAMHAPVRTLSQGQRRRVALARLALLPRALWLLDEPLTSLDGHAGECFREQLDAHLRAGGIAVVATHQPLAARGRALNLGG
ncbi:cytochrome c biogenesis heme-transporting ATPase CcmA [Variovorax ureilyticus]|uniref:cytochrome c biogenesis heme-transporting ATPase CcmA n=1 Tax=Variovorax ureilyticus TaxID=1836198 RepID=UPI003BF5A0A0